VAGVRELPGLFPRNALKMIFFPDGSAFPFSDGRKSSRWPTMATKRHAASYSKKKPEMMLRILAGFTTAHRKQ
jgi:hypothetical protein